MRALNVVIILYVKGHLNVTNNKQPARSSPEVAYSNSLYTIIVMNGIRTFWIVASLCLARRTNHVPAGRLSDRLFH